jgi:riboflavin synthase
MFTGIITHVGKVSEKTSSRVTIEAPTDLMQKLTLGMSIAVNGICLTVTTYNEKSFSIDFMPETAKRTTIQYTNVQDLVNLELPATSETFLAGHIVQGHVDCVGKVTSIKKQGNSQIFTFSNPEENTRYIVEKGSIAVNGISLTVIDVGQDYFTVGIIPHTWDKTMLHKAKVGNFVNIELDILAKYLEKLISKKI